MQYTTGHKVNVRSIRKLAEGEGLTLRNGKVVTYRTGWQVATYGIEVATPEEVSHLLHHSEEWRKGNVGIWFSDGIYYLDKSHREDTKKKAEETGKAHNQQSIYGWAKRKKGQLVWLRG